MFMSLYMTHSKVSLIDSISQLLPPLFHPCSLEKATQNVGLISLYFLLSKYLGPIIHSYFSSWSQINKPTTWAYGRLPVPWSLRNQPVGVICQWGGWGAWNWRKQPGGWGSRGSPDIGICQGPRAHRSQLAAGVGQEPSFAHQPSTAPVWEPGLAGAWGHRRYLGHRGGQCWVSHEPGVTRARFFRVPGAWCVRSCLGLWESSGTWGLVSWDPYSSHLRLGG